MTRFSWYGYEVEIDEAATAAWYAQAGDWGCGCGHCRNFLALARERRLPGEILEILDRLCVPPEKTTDLSELYDQEGRLLYDLHYRLAGRILCKPAEGTPQSENSLWCSDDPGLFYPYGAEGFPAPCFDLCWSPWLPWVLNEPINGQKEET